MLGPGKEKVEQDRHVLCPYVMYVLVVEIVNKKIKTIISFIKCYEGNKENACWGTRLEWRMIINRAISPSL